jgi:acyl-CoA synthetase (AMP-forming)/AMP-acid ligase II
MAAIVDETGKDIPNGSGGMLVIKRPWPSMIRTIWNDPERFKKSYFPEEMGGTLYLAGDGAVRDAKTAYFRITGRIDDVLNVSGHRLGTMEIESALVSKTDLVAEPPWWARPDDLTGEAVCAFVVLKRPRPTGEEARRSPTSCATGWPRRSARSPSPRTSASARTCPRRAAARSCAAVALDRQGRGHHQDYHAGNPASSISCRRRTGVARRPHALA